ncbi:MAG: hypothetical protein PHD03_04375 [Bacilli bacterium]|nr:hypothetical protein [Bacilli bacterium]MDD4407272.1 hypothetical protein [Bacilli bacterium]
MFYPGGYGCGYPPYGVYPGSGIGIIWIIIVIAVLFFIFFCCPKPRPIC